MINEFKDITLEELKSNFYGSYCQMCKHLTIEPVSIEFLTEAEFINVRETYLTFRKF
jgi:hypothetical protein